MPPTASTPAIAGDPSAPDQRLVDQQAFARLAQEHGPALLRLAQRMLGNVSDAEDAVQTAFVQAMGHRQDFHPGAEVRPWLAGITLNACRQLRRREGRLAALHRRAVDLLLREPAAVEEDCGLGQALNRLGAEERTAVWLRYGEGMGFRELAVALGVPQKTAESRVQRALERLRRRMTGSARRSIPAVVLLLGAMGARATAGEAGGSGSLTGNGLLGLNSLDAVGGHAATGRLRWLIGGNVAAVALLVALLLPGSLESVSDPRSNKSVLPTVIVPADQLGLSGRPGESWKSTTTSASASGQLQVTTLVLCGSLDKLRAIGLIRDKESQWTISAAERARLLQQVDHGGVRLLSQPTLVLLSGQQASIGMINQYAYIHDYELRSGVPDPVISVLNTGLDLAVAAEPANSAVRLLMLHTRQCAPREFSTSSAMLTRGKEGQYKYPVEEPSVLFREHNLEGHVDLADGETLVISPEGFRSLIQRCEATRFRQLAAAAGTLIRDDTSNSPSRSAEPETEDQTIAVLVSARQVAASDVLPDDAPSVVPSAISRR